MVLDRGRKRFEAWVRKQLRAKTQGVKVGIVEPKSYPDGTQLLEIAMTHEFGTLDIPKRSFLRAWVDGNGRAISAALEKVSIEVSDPKDGVSKALNQLGAWAAGQIQARISRRIAPALSPTTIERKGSSTPLINKNTLRSSITWKVA